MRQHRWKLLRTCPGKGTSTLCCEVKRCGQLMTGLRPCSPHPKLSLLKCPVTGHHHLEQGCPSSWARGSQRPLIQSGHLGSQGL